MKYIITESQYKSLIEQRVKGDEITPQKYVVHSSNPSNRESISKTGIQKSLGECYLIYADSNYEEDEECVPAVFATNSLKKKDLFDSTYDDDLWLIDTEIANVKWFKDAHFDFGDYPHIVTFEDIPVEAVRLVYKGTGRDTLDSYYSSDDIVVSETNHKKLNESNSLFNMFQQMINDEFESLQKECELEREDLICDEMSTIESIKLKDVKKIKDLSSPKIILVIEIYYNSIFYQPYDELEFQLKYVIRNSTGLPIEIESEYINTNVNRNW